MHHILLLWISAFDFAFFYNFLWPNGLNGSDWTIPTVMNYITYKIIFNITYDFAVQFYVIYFKNSFSWCPNFRVYSHLILLNYENESNQKLSLSLWITVWFLYWLYIYFHSCWYRKFLESDLIVKTIEIGLRFLSPVQMKLLTWFTIFVNHSFL